MIANFASCQSAAPLAPLGNAFCLTGYVPQYYKVPSSWLLCHPVPTLSTPSLDISHIKQPISFSLRPGQNVWRPEGLLQDASCAADQDQREQGLQGGPRARREGDEVLYIRPVRRDPHRPNPARSL